MTSISQDARTVSLARRSARLRRSGLGLAAATALFVAATPQQGRTDARDALFDDPLFRRCVSWMLDGTKGALISNLCTDDYAIPPPSIFICARNVLAGFASASERDGCALIFEEQAARARASRIR